MYRPRVNATLGLRPPLPTFELKHAVVSSGRQGGYYPRDRATLGLGPPLLTTDSTDPLYHCSSFRVLRAFYCPTLQ